MMINKNNKAKSISSKGIILIAVMMVLILILGQIRINTMNSELRIIKEKTKILKEYQSIK